MVLPAVLVFFAQVLSFEVASVKPSAPGSPGPTMRIEPGGRFTADAITLRNLITLAFGISDDNLAGAPSWIDSARYDIAAKPPGDKLPPGSKESRDRSMVRLQSLLAERFGLKTHHSAVERSVLVLRTMRGRAKLEPAAAVGASCPQSADGPARITSMEMLARDLSQRIGQPVIDETGLNGWFCVRKRWAPDEDIPSTIGHLGLRFETQKRPVSILVIDHIERPHPN